MLKQTLFKSVAIVAMTLSLNACSSIGERLSNIGEPPALSPIENAKDGNDYKYVSMPMPEAAPPEPAKANSLWQSARKGFFKDQRASQVGDILTVVIEIDDEAEISNESTRTRTSSETDSLPNLLGFEGYVDDFLPDGVSNANMINLNGATNNVGTGEIEREEEVDMRVAAVISEVLPNGNFVISGKQEVRVNFEVRELYVAGVIRPEDIAPDNSIKHDQIAEARIAYGGKGQITDVQQPRYGHQVLDILYPF